MCGFVLFCKKVFMYNIYNIMIIVVYFHTHYITFFNIIHVDIYMRSGRGQSGSFQTSFSSNPW